MVQVGETVEMIQMAEACIMQLEFLKVPEPWQQRVLNNLWRARLSLAHPLPPSPVRGLDRRHTGKTEKDRQVTAGEGEWGG
jgi:hypothetical protein